MFVSFFTLNKFIIITYSKYDVSVKLWKCLGFKTYKWNKELLIKIKQKY